MIIVEDIPLLLLPLLLFGQMLSHDRTVPSVEQLQMRWAVATATGATLKMKWLPRGGYDTGS